MIRSTPMHTSLLDRVSEVVSQVVSLTTMGCGGDGTSAAELDAALRTQIDVVMDRLRHPEPGDTCSPAEYGMLLAELHEVHLRLCEYALSRRYAAMEEVMAGVERLRSVATPQGLLERVTREVCTSCGFERGVLSRIEGSDWILAGAHFADETAWARDFVRLGAESRPELTHSLLETEMVRRRAATITTDAMSDPRTHKPFVQASATRDYVAAPIMPRGRVIGFIHADYHFSGRPVSAEDRDRLWAFASGFAQAYERVILIERLRAQRDRVYDMVCSTAALTGDLSEREIRLDSTELERTTMRRQTTSVASSAIAATGGETPARLTPRELEVLSLMAAGATNAVIARELFIAEGTVKSHVKRILRKLRASNRAEAVSRFLRFEVGRGDPPSFGP